MLNIIILWKKVVYQIIKYHLLLSFIMTKKTTHWPLSDLSQKKKLYFIYHLLLNNKLNLFKYYSLCD
jgi:hypothetical protein